MNDSAIKPFAVREASRVGIIPLLGLWGSTGSGKTKSALILMRGIIGPKGRLGVIDTEGKRASYYYDDPDIGGFKVIDFDAPYTPERYAEAYAMAESNFDGIVVDSASHCWEGADGVLDLHEQALDRMLKDKKDDWAQRERLNWPAWREPKQRFNKLRGQLLGHKIPLILCFRAKYKSRMVKVDGRNTVTTDQHTTPIFDDSFIFEMHVAMEVFQKDGMGGYVDFPMPYAKTSHKDLRAALPEAGKEQLKTAHGTAIGRWSSAPSLTQKSGDLTGKTGTPPALKVLKKQLWDLTESIHKGDPQALEQWLIDESIISDTEALEHLAASRYPEVIEKTKAKLSESA